MGKPLWWDEKKREVRCLLIKQVKKSDEFLTYGQVCDMVENCPFEPGWHIFHDLLGEISWEEYEEGRPLLSVIVVNQETMKPGGGLIKLAEACGYDVTDPDAWWLKEVERLQRFWRNPANAGVYLRVCSEGE